MNGYIEQEFTKLRSWLEENGKAELAIGQTVICPICQKAKTREEFSKEHIVPASIGGKELTITCKDCNSRCGHEFDYSIKNFLDHQQVLTGPSEHKAKVVIDNTNLNAHFKKGEGPFKLIVNGRNNNPEDIDDILKRIKEPVFNFKLQISSKWGLTSLSRALIKMAQLMSVPKENYRFVLSECGMKISEIILGQNNENISHLIHMFLPDNDLPTGYYETEFDKNQIRICIIKLERERKGDVIYFMVFLPGEKIKWDNFIDITKNMAEIAKSHSLALISTA